jgi:predicted Zn-dependent protease
MRIRPFTTRVLAVLLALSIAAPTLLEARFQPTTGMDAFSKEQEIQAGQEAAAKTTKELPLLPDSDPLARYVSRLGQTLASHAPGDKWPYSFHVVNQKEINAFALPGGPIYVNVGTIQATDNEAQLAGVLAHEISHVVQRHATRAATKQMQAQIPLAILGAVLGGRGSMLGQLAQLGISFGVGSYFLKNSRQAEREADLLGADIMYDTGYDPHQLAAFFEKLQSQGTSRAPAFLSDHPDPGNRAASVGDEVRTLPPKQFTRDSAEFQTVKREAGSMRPMTSEQIAQQQKAGGFNNGSPATGGGAVGSASNSGAAPAGNFRTFQHQAFRINYPGNWQVMGDQSSSVTIAPPNGVTQNAVAYGVIIDGFQPQSGNSLEQATRDLIDRLRQGNPELRVIGNAEDIRVNGVAGKSVDMIGPSPINGQNGQPVRERDWLVTMQMQNGDLLYLVFIAPDADFNSLRSQAFEPMLKSLHLQQ